MQSVFQRLPVVRGGIPEELAGLALAIRENSPRVDMREIIRAYHYARGAHTGQYRRSGEEYITHPVAVATTLAEFGLDTSTIIAALLHDVVEDTPASLQQISDYFSPEVMALVDGVTKLDRLQVASKQEQQAETLRKMILAMSKDIRVLMIKLADRLHNMETMGAMPREKQKQKAQETLDIYAPLAHRLGISAMKLRLEDLGFKVLHPKRHDEIVAMVAERQPEREAYLEEVVSAVREDLREMRIRAEVSGRPKHYYSIYEKMVLRGKEFDEIHDLVAIRVVTHDPEVQDCYAVLGQIHARWQPLPGRFKDYIATPKFNLYRSLHTSVIGPKGRALEIQIRTREMHNTAEYGVAAHWKYKDQSNHEQDVQHWLDHMVEWQQDVDDPEDYLESLKIDLYQDEVFVFTPNGDAKALPAKSTPIDFAYAIHTEVGHRCIGARVNGRLVSLDQRLVNGDVVEIMTSKAEDAGPSRDWLKIATSSRARTKIRAWFNRERREDATERGRDAIVRALRRKGMAYSRASASGELVAAARANGLENVEGLFRAVGEGRVQATSIANDVAASLTEVDETPEPDLAPTSQPIRIGTDTDDVAVDGSSGMLVKLARCCSPVPGDTILGFVTRGRGISVHRHDCPNMSDLQQEQDRFVPVEWTGTSGTYLVSIEIEALDRKHLLRDITSVLGDLHVNITSAQVHTRRDRIATLRFTFEVADPTHLEYVLDSVRAVDAVYDAYRMVPQRA